MADSPPQSPDIAFGISLSTSLGDYFKDPVSEAIRGKDVEASPAIETYLVQLLSDFAKPSEETTSSMSEPLTFLLRDAMAATGSTRFKKLQSLGDGVLYDIGFFGQALRGRDREYVVHVGASAYEHAAQMLRTGQGRAAGPDVLSELARKFERFVEVLAYVSDWVLAKSASGHQGVVLLYDRWLRTGSAVLKNELGQRGLLAVPNRGGVH